MGFKLGKNASITLCYNSQIMLRGNGPQQGQDANGLVEQLLVVKYISK